MDDEKLQFDLVSPERLLLSGQADQVVVPGSEGDFGVMVNHAPLMATLRPGVLEVYDTQNTRFFIRAGFAEVTDEKLVVLAEKVIDLSNCDAATLDAEIRNVREDVADATTQSARTQANEQLTALEELRSTLPV